MTDAEIMAMTRADIARMYEAHLSRLYTRPATEQNFQKRQRENEAYRTDREMMAELRPLIASLEASTQSAAEHASCARLLAWIDAKQGAMR